MRAGQRFKLSPASAMSSHMHEIRTDRTLLRPWRSEDLVPFASLNADSRVTEFLPGPIGREESDRLAVSIAHHFATRGFGLWALELPGRAAFAGFVGLIIEDTTPAQQGRRKPTYANCAEIAWRIAAEHWGHGYASEAATAALAHGFQRLHLDRIIACTVPANQQSRRVMEKLGMVRDPAADFDHYRMPAGHRLQAHVLYRLERDAWSARIAHS
jgi:RimJ/RimL family protein N-acetyltransferase